LPALKTVFCCGALKTAAISVLCVDDNPRVLQALKTALTAAGFAVETASSGWEALRRLRGSGTGFRVVVTDVRMPELNGVKMIRQSRALGYKGPFVVCAAGVFDADRAGLIALGVEQIIDKTDGMAPLIEAVQQAAAGYDPAPSQTSIPAAPAPAVLDPQDDADWDDDSDGGSDEELGRRYHGPSKGR
jgi:CheY-like chemotaxis protein